MNHAPTRIALLMSLAALAACSSAPVATTATPTAPPVAAPAAPTRPAPTAQTVPMPARSTTTSALPPHLDPGNPIFSERSVYFGFDDFSIPDSDLPKLERQGRYLAMHPSLNVKIEGNADERGSAEYNLSLGQKRAQAVLQALKVYGVRDGQMEAISWGKEKPKATGHDEAAWAQNRRADIAYPRP